MRFGRAIHCLKSEQQEVLVQRPPSLNDVHPVMRLFVWLFQQAILVKKGVLFH